MSATSAFLRLELGDALRSPWLAFTAAAYGVLFGAVVFLHRDVSEPLVIVLPLVALAATSPAITRARTTGYFELLFAQPCTRQSWFGAVLASRVALITAPLLALVLLAPPLARSVAVTAALVWAFAGVGLLVSAGSRTPERAIVAAIVVWLATSSLLVGLSRALGARWAFVVDAACPLALGTVCVWAALRRFRKADLAP